MGPLLTCLFGLSMYLSRATLACCQPLIDTDRNKSIQIAPGSPDYLPFCRRRKLVPQSGRFVDNFDQGWHRLRTRDETVNRPLTVTVTLKPASSPMISLRLLVSERFLIDNSAILRRLQVRSTASRTAARSLPPEPKPAGFFIVLSTVCY